MTGSDGLLPGDLVSVDKGSQLFALLSSWSDNFVLREPDLAIVLFASEKRTGAGRLWHVLLTRERGMMWIEGPGTLERVTVTT